MRRLFLHIALFSLPFWGMLAWLILAPQDPAYSYNMIQKDCRTGMWIYRRLFESKAPIDIAFLGTSKTMCDVDDGLVEKMLNDGLDTNLRIANLGVCRIGANLHYLIARDLLAHKQPRIVIYEVGNELAPNSHFGFTHLATAEDIATAPIRSKDYFSNWLDFGWNRLVYHREAALGVQRSFHDFLEDSLHSYMRVEHETVADSALMAREKAKRAYAFLHQDQTPIAQWLEEFQAKQAKYYISALGKACKAHDIKLVFLYLPSYGVRETKPRAHEFLQNYGDILIPPDSVFTNPKLHFDPNHLNGYGANSLSYWLTNQLAALLSK